MTINPDNRFYPFSEKNFADIVALLIAKGKRKKVKAGETILFEGSTCDFFFYVEYGCFRACRHIEEKTVNIGFSFKGDLDTCPSTCTLPLIHFVKI